MTGPLKGNRQLDGFLGAIPFLIPLGVPSPFVPGILLFGKPSKTQGKQAVFEKNDGVKEWKRNQPLKFPHHKAPATEPVF